MTEPKYKTNIKSKLTKIAGDVEKLLGVRGPAPEASPAKGGEPPKKP